MNDKKANEKVKSRGELWIEEMSLVLLENGP